MVKNIEFFDWKTVKFSTEILRIDKKQEKHIFIDFFFSGNFIVTDFFHYLLQF